MSNIQEVVSGDVIITGTFTGLGTNLTNIPRTGIQAATANSVIINDASGNLSSATTLAPKLGGTGVDSSNSSGLVRLTAGSWSFAATVADADIASNAAIARTKIAAATANSVVINDASGNLSSTPILSVINGGLGQNFSAVAGPVLLTVISGNVAASLTYNTTATINSIVQRDASGNIAAANVNCTLVNTPTIANIGGDLNITSTGGNIRFGTNTISQQPATVGGGNMVYYSSNLLTTSATTTNILTIPTASGSKGTTYSIRAHISAGDNTGGSNTGAIHFMTKAKNLQGTLTTGAMAYQNNNLDTGFNIGVAVVASSTTIQIRVTGLASTSIYWVGHFEVVSQQF